MIDSMVQVAQVVIKSNADQFTVLIALLIAIIGPFAGTYMFVKNSNKVFGAIAGGIGKVGKAAQKWANGWAKEKQANSRFARARAWNKSLKEANRIERQGKMTGFQGGLNKAASLAAGPSFSRRKWAENAGKYQVSASNRAAKEADKIFDEDKGNAAANYAKNGIAGPLMVAHARSGRVVQEYKDENGKIAYKYGRKLTEAEHAAAVEWTMANGKLAERQEVYGADWASKGRTPEYSRALDTMNDGYFHVNKDVARFGNRFGGTMTSGTVGGDIGVDNAALVNMASGKTAAEAIIDNDMAQTLADLSALSDNQLEERITKFGLLPPEFKEEGVPEADSVKKYAERFRENAKKLAQTIEDNRELKSKVKPEFAPALEELRSRTPDPQRVARSTTPEGDKNTRLNKRRERLDDRQVGAQIDLNPDESLRNIQPALEKLEERGTSSTP